MNLSIPKIILVLGAVGLGYLFVSNDEPIESRVVDHQQRAVKPLANPQLETHQFRPGGRQYEQSPVYPPTYSNQSAQSEGAVRYWSPQLTEPRFRPLDQGGQQSGAYQPDMQQSKPGNPTFSYDSPPVHDYPAYRYPYDQTPTNPMLERFRPWDEKRQSKRWQGNFHRMTTWPDQLATPGYPSMLRLAGSN